MDQIRPLWRILIAFVLFSFASGNSYNMGYDGGRGYLVFCIWVAAFITWVVMCFKIKYISPEERRRQAAEAREARLAEERAARDAKLAEERAARDARQAEWDRTHGRMFFNIAGVTFANEDGRNRQDLLKEVLASGCDGDLTFEEFEYNGKPAVRIVYNDDFILGNVPARDVKKFLEICDKISHVDLDIKSFTPEDVDDDYGDDGSAVRRGKGKLFRAAVSIVYLKYPE